MNLSLRFWDINDLKDSYVILRYLATTVFHDFKIQKLEKNLYFLLRFRDFFENIKIHLIFDKLFEERCYPLIANNSSQKVWFRFPFSKNLSSTRSYLLCLPKNHFVSVSSIKASCWVIANWCSKKQIRSVNSSSFFYFFKEKFPQSWRLQKV